MLINKQSSEPIYKQVIDQYKKLIVSHALKPHEQLSSLRKLSLELSVNPNTLQKAYTLLDEQGICYSVPGKGRFVSDNAIELIIKDKSLRIKKLYIAVEELVMCNVSYQEILQEVEKAYSLSKKKLAY